MISTQIPTTVNIRCQEYRKIRKTMEIENKAVELTALEDVPNHQGRKVWIH